MKGKIYVKFRYLPCQITASTYGADVSRNKFNFTRIFTACCVLGLAHESCKPELVLVDE